MNPAHSRENIPPPPPHYLNANSLKRRTQLEAPAPPPRHQMLPALVRQDFSCMQQLVAPQLFASSGTPNEQLQRATGGLPSVMPQPLGQTMLAVAQFDRQPHSNCSHDSGCFQSAALTPPTAPPEAIACSNTSVMGAVCVVSAAAGSHCHLNANTYTNKSSPPSVSPPGPNLALTPPNSSLGSNASDTNSGGDSPSNQQAACGPMRAMLDVSHRSPDASSPSGPALNPAALHSLGSVNMSPPYSVQGTRKSFSFSPQESSTQQAYPLEEFSLFTPNANAYVNANAIAPADKCGCPLPSAFEILSAPPNPQVSAPLRTLNGAAQPPLWLHPMELEQLNSAVFYYGTDGTPLRPECTTRLAAPHAAHWP